MEVARGSAAAATATAARGLAAAAMATAGWTAAAAALVEEAIRAETHRRRRPQADRESS